MRRFVILIISLSILAWVWGTSGDYSPEGFHTQEELAFYQKASGNDFVGGFNSLFAAAGECTGCHGTDPQNIAGVDEDGNDINVADDWKATMMAMSANDPFWRAKVSHEVLVASPELQAELESSCTDCHAPMGFFNAMHLGFPHYTMDDLRADSVALDGVSCNSCHQISPDSVGLTFSGKDIKYVEDTIYGQYEDPFAGPMQSFVGFMPVYSEHISRSEVCASCHTLITETVGLDGQFNGNTFVEQATYHEWVNSAYNTDGEGGVECQGCHMTSVNDDVVIAANILALPPRSPFSRHDWVGGNTFMLELMKNNRDTLGILASEAQIDSIESATFRMLQQESLDISVTERNRDADSLYVDVELTNKAGHKFPSGYPSRIAWVKVTAVTEEGETIFASGVLGDDYEIIGRDFEFEPHYDVIRSEEEVQVYEIVLADESGAETTVLSQADFTLKDNRLVPFGFTDTHFAYDTTRMYGRVLEDDDFNLDFLNNQGTGRDMISYHIPLDGYSGEVDVNVEVYFQITPPRWLASMFEFSSPDIDLFQWMYENADKEPVLVGSEDILSSLTSLDPIDDAVSAIIAYPNPTRAPQVMVWNQEHRSIDGIRVFDSMGRLVSEQRATRGQRILVELAEASGLYFVEVRVGQERQVLEVLKW